MTVGPHRTALFAGVLLSVATVTLGGAAGAEGSGDASGLRSVLERREPETRERADVERELADARLEDLWTLARTGWAAALDSEEPVRWWGSPDQLGGLAIGGLRHVAPATVVEHAEEEIATDASTEARLEIVRVLGDLGRSEALPLVLETLDHLSPRERASRSVTRTFERAVNAIFDTDPEASGVLARRATSMSAAQRLVVVTGCVRPDRPDLARLAAALVGADPKVDERALPIIGELAARYPWLLDWLTPVLTSGLHDSAPGVRAVAAVELGELGGFAAVSELLGALEDSDSRVRRAAEHALATATGATGSRSEVQTTEPGDGRSPLFRAWSARCDQEAAWWDETGSTLLEQLSSDDAGRVFHAARRLAEHPLFHAELARRLSEQLVSLPTDVVPGVCALLERVSSPHAVPGLVDALERRPRVLGPRVSLVLESLTGEPFGSDVERWRDYVDG